MKMWSVLVIKEIQIKAIWDSTSHIRMTKIGKAISYRLWKTVCKIL